MKKIMFNDRYGLTEAVLKGRKTMTRRPTVILKGMKPDNACDPIMGIDDKGKVYFTFTTRFGQTDVYPQYQIGEVVAVTQAYKNDEVLNHLAYDEHGEKRADGYELHQMALHSPGYKNKMFVRADLMPHRIKITNISIERLQDISDDDCAKEGKEPRAAFRSMISKMMGKKVWADNPWVLVYEFELVK